MSDKKQAAFKAVSDGNLGGVLLAVAGEAEANFRDETGRSLLAAAILKRNQAIILILLQKGAAANGFATSDESPHLLFAIQSAALGSKGIDVVELLLQNGADIGAVDGSGNSVLHIAASAGPMSLYSAYMTRYLIGAGASVDATNDLGQTPLHIAVTTIAKETVSILCKQGGKIDTPDAKGKTPLEKITESWANDDEYGYLVEQYTQLLESFGTRV